MKATSNIVFIALLLAPAPLAGAATDAPAAVAGRWVVKRLIPASNIQAVTEADVKALISTEITYSASEMKSGNQILKGIQYEVRTLSASQFFEDARIPLKTVGIKSTSVVSVAVRQADGAPAGAIGAMVYVASRSRLLLLWDGGFFEAQRLSDGASGSR